MDSNVIYFIYPNPVVIEVILRVLSLSNGVMMLLSKSPILIPVIILLRD